MIFVGRGIARYCSSVMTEMSRVKPMSLRSSRAKSMPYQRMSPVFSLSITWAKSPKSIVM